MGEEFVARARAWGCGFSRYVTLGNQADVGIAEILEAFLDHEATRVVALYARGASTKVAGSPRPRRGARRRRPTGGAAGAGALRRRRARRALAHGVAGFDSTAVLDAVCRATGILRVDSPRELFELTVALLDRAAAARASGGGVTDGGGHGGIAADALEAAGLRVPALGACADAAVAARAARERRRQPRRFRPGHDRPRRLCARRARGGRRGRGRRGRRGRAAGLLGGDAFPSTSISWRQRWTARDVLAATVRETAGLPLVVSTVYPDAAPAVRLRARRRARVPRDRLRGRGASPLWWSSPRARPDWSAYLPRAGPPARGQPRLLGGAQGPRRRRSDVHARSPRPRRRRGRGGGSRARLPGRGEGARPAAQVGCRGSGAGPARRECARRCRGRHGAAPAPARLRGGADGTRRRRGAHRRLPLDGRWAGRWRWSAPAACTPRSSETRSRLWRPGGRRRAGAARGASWAPLLSGARGRGALDLAAAATATAA